MAKVENVALESLNDGTVTFDSSSGWMATELPTRREHLLEREKNNLQKETGKMKKQVLTPKPLNPTP